MKKWEVESVISPDLIYPEYIAFNEETQKLQSLLEQGFEPFAVMANRIYLRRVNIDE